MGVLELVDWLHTERGFQRFEFKQSGKFKEKSGRAFRYEPQSGKICIVDEETGKRCSVLSRRLLGPCHPCATNVSISRRVMVPR